MDIHSQGLLVAASLIGCTVFSVVLCIRVLPSPADSLAAAEQAGLRRNNKLVLGWVLLACINLIVGHLISYYVLGTASVC